jgi:hypothetical protein
VKKALRKVYFFFQLTAGIRDAALKKAVAEGIDPEEAPLPPIEGHCFIDMIPLIQPQALTGYLFDLRKHRELMLDIYNLAVVITDDIDFFPRL